MTRLGVIALSYTQELSDEVGRSSLLPPRVNMASASSFAVHRSELDGIDGRASIPGIVVMLAVYRTGGHEQQEFNEITMSNIEPESFR